MKRILLVGSGGVGTIASFTLDSCSDVEVTTVVRSDYVTVAANGYKIESVDHGNIDCYRPSKIVRSIDAASAEAPYDYVVICTKNTPDIFPLEELVAPVISTQTVVVLVQNGINIEEAFFKKFPQNVVLSGVSMISSTNYGGVISHVSHDSLKIGYFPNINLPRDLQEKVAREFVGYYQTGKNTCVYDPDVKFTRWNKLVYNATLNPICALTNVDVGRLEMFGGIDTLVRGAMKEVMAVAKADGVDLPFEVMELMIRSDDGVYYAPLMLVDIRKGNYVELEVICGNPVKIAQKLCVDAPILTIVYSLLLVVQKRLMEAKGKINVPEKRPMPAAG
ncbi:2-dehydropantoate 2-reductase [Metschnikowia bicuspidata var. bicuspidata NRRL YB-4993]|uniref:2-dehydropantoate 2-reductase n=1 Tax=Metschnikowia bicuspidata var. bicuspidata NRRL YB-4993 TaxID=869754 RepID=A0A1A0H8U8_9ASCO|nr:2-dehydropantoate 2-reductase [Metschnikowia bicuspidata var. bicuspidata NRRL YB-4993]OBA20307.1 2-dehydropantoate 2-reductase [Metschnikowia bicuspidata var. bicuspidata NRRL YB-4993]